jgi:putative acetyltransferase
MSSHATFREATSDDAAAIRQCHLDAIAAFDERIYSAVQKMSWAFGLKPDAYVQAMADGERFEVAVDQAGSVKAFSRCKPGEIYGLFVHPTGQGQNLGSLLLDRAEQWLRVWHPGLIKLDATLHAVQFYKKRGWSLVRIKTMRTRGGLFQEIGLMEKYLAPERETG